MPDISPRLIEQALEEVGYELLVEEGRDAFVLTGVVDSEGDREAVLDVVRRIAPGACLDDNITVAAVLPGETREATLSEVEVAGFDGAEEDLSDPESIMPGDFTDQERVVSPRSAQPASLSGDVSALAELDENVTEGEAVYTPPTDPVGTDTEVIGGFSASSTDSVEVARSSDGTIGDEAIADAIRRELREDAATTGLEVEVEVARGIARLRGEVRDIVDVESAEEVAARVPGVVEVAEEFTVAGMDRNRGR